MLFRSHLLQEHPAVALGVSAAGLISSDRQTILATGNISGWNGVNLKNDLNKFVDLPIVIENDANSAAWGEARYGAGVGEDHMILLTIGTVVGGGAIIDGKPLQGAHGIAAKFEHMRVVPEGCSAVAAHVDALNSMHLEMR